MTFYYFFEKFLKKLKKSRKYEINSFREKDFLVEKNIFSKFKFGNNHVTTLGHLTSSSSSILDAPSNREVLIDKEYWIGPVLIPKFWQREKKKKWKQYKNYSHRN